jgi:plasmid stability protein
MPVNLSVKNVPDDVAEKLRTRARANHRSLQGELLALLQEAVSAPRRLSAAELLREVRKSGLRTPRESTTIVRSMRNSR